ncbi:MAG: hypothetical protein ACREEE_00180 [Dongiaceae bacterium]
MTRIEDENVFLHVLRATGGQLEVLVVSHRPDGSGGTDLYQGHVSALGDRRFVNLRPAGNTSVDDSNPDLNYLIVGYEFDDAGHLVAHFLAEQPLVDAIAAGTLTGEVTDDGDGFGRSIVVTADSSRLADYLAAGNATVILDKAMTFDRTPAAP